METIQINRPVKLVNTDLKIIKNVFTNIIEEYDDFDLQLMKKYYETKDLDESHFKNI